MKIAKQRYLNAVGSCGHAQTRARVCIFYFSRVRVGAGPIFSFNQIHFDFSLKSKYNGAKVNV